MERIKHLFFINENKPEDVKYMERADSRLFMFMAFFFLLALPIGVVLYGTFHIRIAMDEMFFVVTGAWVLNTIWALFSDREDTSNVRFAINCILCLGSIPILGSFIFIHPIYSLVMLVATLFLLLFLITLSDNLKKYWEDIIQLRWGFFVLMLLSYSFVIYNETAYISIPYKIADPLTYAFELYIVSFFIVLKFVYFKKDVKSFYNEQTALAHSNSESVYDIGDEPGGLNCVMKSFAEIFVNFIMLLIVCTQIGIYILAEFIWK